MKKVLIVSTSLRKDSNSEALAEAFARGAREAGHEVELISLRGKTVGFCRGCFTGEYPAEVTVETFKGKERGGMNFDSKCQGIEE